MSPQSLDPRSPREYRRRASVIIAYGLTALIVGVAGMIDRELLGSSSVGAALDGPVPAIWLGTYALGGFLAAGGALALRPELETIGDYLLLASAVINAAAIFSVRGPIGGGVTSSGILLAAWVLHRRIGDLHDAARADRRRLDLPIAHDERRGA